MRIWLRKSWNRVGHARHVGEHLAISVDLFPFDVEQSGTGFSTAISHRMDSGLRGACPGSLIMGRP